MAFQADSAVFVPVVPAFKGFNKAMDAGTVPAALKAGQSAGAAFGKAFSSKSVTGGDAIAALQKRIAASVQQASKKIAAARSLEEDAARKANIAELKLQELRKTGKASASQLAAAEDRLIKSQKALAVSAGRTKTATQDLDDVQSKSNAELREAKDASKRAGTAYGSLGDKVKAAGAQVKTTGGAFSNLGAKIKSGIGGPGGIGGAIKGSLSGALGGIPGLIAGVALGIGRGVARIAAGAVKVALGVAIATAYAAYKAFQIALKFGIASIAEGREAQKTGKTTAAIIKSTGGAAKVSAKDIERYTRALSAKTGIDDEAITKGSNLLLTFKNVRNETGKGNKIFNRATQSMVDLSKAGFGDLTATSKALGKALNDPVRGIAALGKAGVTFTDKQKATIEALVKSGNILGAQKIIMKEVESQVGGVAAASATAGEKLKVAFDNTKEAIGTALLPALDKAETAMRTKFLPLLEKKLLPALPSIIHGFRVVSGAIGKAFTWIAANAGSIGKIFEVIGSSAVAFAHIAGGAIKTFLSGLTGGKGTFKDFADYIATHQTDIILGFVKLAEGALDFGIMLAIAMSGGIRAFADVADAADGLSVGVQTALLGIATAAAAAFGWVPGLGPLLQGAAASLTGSVAVAVEGFGKTGEKARGAADLIDGKLVPSLAKAKIGLQKTAREEIIKASTRDAAAKAAIAIIGIGKAADGSQVKIKNFAQWSKLGAKGQQELVGRLEDAKGALINQYKTIVKANGGQKALTKGSDKAKVAQGQLTKAWEKGKERLYKEFRQMGLSKKAAHELARKYAGIKPKVQTKFTQPGMKDAKRDTQTLANRIRDIKGRKVDIHFSTNASAVSAKLKKLRGGGSVPAKPKPFDPLMAADGGEITGKGGPRQDNIAGIDKRTGLQTAWVSAKEFVVNAKAYAANRMLIHAINAGRKIRPVGLAGGGEVKTKIGAVPKSALELGPKFNSWSDWNSLRFGALFGNAGRKALQKRLDSAGVKGGGYAAALSYAKRHEGHPYVFGSLWDCSGFISSLHSIIKGQKPHRMYSTPAFHGSSAQGFTQGKKSAFMIGVNPAPGKFGHMAGTLNKVNVESAGGVGVRVGGGARGWNNGMFSWRGGLAVGGPVPQRLRRAGDLPFDTLDPRGQRYDPQLARIFGSLNNRPLADGGPVVSREASLTRRQMERGGSAAGNTRNQYGDVYTVSAKQLWAEERAEEQRYATLHRRW